MKYTLALIVMVAISGCSSAPTEPEHGEAGSQTEAIVERGGSNSNYEAVLERWTKSDRKYSGLENKFELTATLLSVDIIEAQYSKDASQYKWAGEDARKKHDAAFKDSTNSSRVFLSFFTPVEENSRLDKADSVWHIFLIVDGKQYDARMIKRIFGNMADLKQKYPYHNPWSKAFDLTFPVSTDIVSRASSVKLVMSGPVGHSELIFK